MTGDYEMFHNDPRYTQEIRHLPTEDDFAWSLNDMAKKFNGNSVAYGFWEEGYNVAEKIALMHSELSEALEAVRHGNPPDKHCPEFSNLEVELADVIIRVGDLAAHLGLRLGEAVVAKHAFNVTRPHKHGKAF